MTAGDQEKVRKSQTEQGSLYVAGARPALIWICGFGLAWAFVIHPMLLWTAWFIPAYGQDLSSVPTANPGELLTLFLTITGLGGMRTYEKKLGVARTAITEVES